MTDSTLWWLLAGGAVVLELLSGTFYLLMLAIGLVAAALAAHAGADLTAQLVVAAVVGGGAIVTWRWHRAKSAATPGAANRNVNLDIGETVHVSHWSSDGTTQVKYRGAQWTAVLAAGAAPTTGAHDIVDLRGSQLVLELHQP